MRAPFSLLIAALCMSAPAALSAQTLHQDIEVEQKVSVARRDAQPLTVLPELALPPVAAASLDYSARVVATKVPNGVTTLEPAVFADPNLSTTHRGYAAIGLFPRYPLGVSAGYRAIATPTTRLNIWAQYDGDAYRRDGWLDANGDFHSTMWRDHAATLGLSLRRQLSRRRMLEVGVSGLWGRNNMPGYRSTAGQSAAKVDARIALSSMLGDMKWRIGADYTYFGFFSLDVPASYTEPGNDLTAVPQNPLSQHYARLSASARLPMSESTAIGADFAGEMLSTSDHLRSFFPYGLHDQSYVFGTTTGLLRLTPYFRAANEHVTFKAGAELSATLNDGRAFHVAPQCLLAWTPSALFAIEARAHGGAQLNPTSWLYTDVTPYLNPYTAYSQSNIPLVADLRIAIGSFMGASLEATAGYAKANGWLMPVETNDTYGGLIMGKTDVKGWRWGLALAYDNGSNLEARIGFTRTPGGVTNAWYADLDRARKQFDVRVAIRPMPALRLEAAYTVRASRSTAILVLVDDVVNDPATNRPIETVRPGLACASLGNAADLSAGASFQATEALSFFVRGRNLLNNSYLMLGGRPAQGVTALVGAQLLF